MAAMRLVAYLHLLQFAVDVVSAQARAADGLQQAQHVARRLRHGVRAEVLDQPHQVVELLPTTHVVLVVLRTRKT